MARDPRLQVVLVLQALRLDACLALGAVLPAHLRTLVAADVHHVAGEQAAHVVEHVLHELDRLVVAEAEDVLLDAPHEARLAGGEVLRHARELRVGGERSKHVPRQLDLRDDRDVALGGVGDDLADVRLGVEVGAVLHAVELVGVLLRPLRRALAVADACRAHGSILDEFGVARDVEAPTLVLRKVPVEAVELVLRHQVEHLLDRLLAEEVAALVEVRAAPAVGGGVLDLHARPGFSVLQLRERHAGVEAPGRVGARHGDAVGGHLQAVALRRHGGVRHVADLRVLRHAPGFDQLRRLRHEGDGRKDEREVHADIIADFGRPADML